MRRKEDNTCRSALRPLEAARSGERNHREPEGPGLMMMSASKRFSGRAGTCLFGSALICNTVYDPGAIKAGVMPFSGLPVRASACLTLQTSPAVIVAWSRWKLFIYTTPPHLPPGSTIKAENNQEITSSMFKMCNFQLNVRVFLCLMSLKFGLWSWLMWNPPSGAQCPAPSVLLCWTTNTALSLFYYILIYSI